MLRMRVDGCMIEDCMVAIVCLRFCETEALIELLKY